MTITLKVFKNIMKTPVQGIYIVTTKRITDYIAKRLLEMIGLYLSLLWYKRYRPTG